MRRAVTALIFPLLLMSAWDCVTMTRQRAQLWKKLRDRHRDAPDAVWDRYYALLNADLPSGTIGLVQTKPAGTVPQQREYYFLQYALAPRLVVPGSSAEFVVACAPAAAAASIIDTSRFVLVRRFEDDFSLYRRMQP